MTNLIKNYQQYNMPSNIFLLEFSTILQTRNSSSQQGMKLECDSIKEIILANLPDILLTLFPVTMPNGELSGQTIINRLDIANQSQDVSMNSDHSTSRSFVQNGKEYLNKMMGTNHFKFLNNYLETVSALSHIMDPWREGSIASIALSSDGLKFWHKIPLDCLLNKYELEQVVNNNFDSLPNVFHNLSADSDKQKGSFRQGLIMLNSWELLCLLISKHICSLNSTNSFYQVQEDLDSTSQRFDDSRLSLIILTKLVEFV